MTPTPASGPTVADLIAQASYLLLDFDGPICDIFAGLPAATVADRLRKLITGQGITMPAEIISTADPLEVFTYSATVSADLAARVEAEMADQELTAITTAEPIPYVHEVVTSCRDSGRQVAVVSNNADRAVRAYLTRHGLADRIAVVAARTSSDPALLKPSPHLIQQAIAQLSARAAECILVGDSTTDCPGRHPRRHPQHRLRQQTRQTQRPHPGRRNSHHHQPRRPRPHPPSPQRPRFVRISLPCF